MVKKTNLNSLSPEVRRLQRLVDKQAEELDDLRKARFHIPTGKRRRKGKTFTRVIVPDSHGAHIDKLAAAAFLKDLEILNPHEIVLLGDHIDCGGFLAQHHTLGFVPETSYSFAEDVTACNTFLDNIQMRVQRPKIYYIVGNHEARIEKWIIKETLRHPRDAEYFFRMFGTESVLGLKKRGIQIVNRNETYDGLRKKGTIKLGKCLFHHGTRTGVHAAKANLDDLGANVCFGHTHRISSFVKETASGVIGAWSFGCLCELHPLYGDTRVSGWAHGYGVQVVGADGRFMTMSVPIIDGQSYLANMMGSA